VRSVDAHLFLSLTLRSSDLVAQTRRAEAEEKQVAFYFLLSDCSGKIEMHLAK